MITEKQRQEFIDGARAGLMKYGAKPGSYVSREDLIFGGKIVGCCAAGGYLLSLKDFPDSYNEPVSSIGTQHAKNIYGSSYFSGVITGFDDKVSNNEEGKEWHIGYIDGQMLRNEFIPKE